MGRLPNIGHQLKRWPQPKIYKKWSLMPVFLNLLPASHIPFDQLFFNLIFPYPVCLPSPPSAGNLWMCKSHLLGSNPGTSVPALVLACQRRWKQLYIRSPSTSPASNPADANDGPWKSDKKRKGKIHCPISIIFDCQFPWNRPINCHTLTPISLANCISKSTTL